jgi:hypothetical protein
MNRYRTSHLRLKRIMSAIYTPADIAFIDQQ